MLKKLLPKILLLCLTLAMCAAFIEVALRLFFPTYQYAAEASYSRDNMRIWKRNPNERSSKAHPATKKKHAVIYNNHALHQHRDFTQEDLESSVNLAFFGDSFTENRRVASAYAFTEPLDFLLNRGEGRFNTLNFGVDAYGPGQCYIYYRYSPLARHLDHVFYVFCINDLRNIYESKLYSIDEDGALVSHEARRSPWWIRVASRFHLTYMLMDMRYRLLPGMDARMGEVDEIEKNLKKSRKSRSHDEHSDAIQQSILEGTENPHLDRAAAIFTAILREWREAVEANGGRFYVVVLPRPQEQHALKFLGDEQPVIDLYKLFDQAIEDYNYDDWTFGEMDDHWDESGNFLAARELYKAIVPYVQIDQLPDEKLQQSLYTYYAAFPKPWSPDFGVRETEVSAEALRNIVLKYTALEQATADQP